MNDNIPVVHDKPAFLRFAVHAALFLVIFFCRFEHTFGERIQHSVAGAVADDKIIGKGCNVFDIEKQNILTLFVLQGFDDLMCKFECVQFSPRSCKFHSVISPAWTGCNGAEKSLV